MELKILSKSYRIFLLLSFFVCFLISFGAEEYEVDHRFEKTGQIIVDAVNSNLIPGAVLLVGDDEDILFHHAYGYGSIYDVHMNKLAEPEVMTTGHLFDIASMTKIFATTYGLMLLHNRGLLDIDSPVSSYIDAFNTEDKKEITVRQLLTHTSGLMQWFPTYYVSNNSKERLEFIVNHKLTGSIGEQRRYSDLGFMILADLIETITGESFDAFLDNEIYQPLGLMDTGFNPDPGRFQHIASTSHGNPFEKRMVYDDNFGYTVDADPDSWSGWRDYVLRGEVNDGNAFYTHNGIAGHAGLFSTAEELYRLSSILLNNGQYNNHHLFTLDTIRLFLTSDRFGHGLGFMMEPGPLHSKDLPEGSFGHTGFTGTSFVVIPERDLIVILLTNRQHFGVDEDGYYPNLRELRENVIRVILEEK
jgi:serine-type D-Ala-D-Ala carboxypeptidase